MADYCDPDLMLITGTNLDSSIFSSELLPKGVSPILELGSQLSEITNTFRNNPKITLILGGDFNAGGID